MKLLIVTQKVDKNDPILGFFHRWLEELAKHYEQISVICLGKGQVALPPNVSVYSLGKEEGQSVFKYVFRFYKYIWGLRREYDAVFVHMNQEYVLLSGDLWRLMGKKVYLWRNHAQGDLCTYLAVWLSHKVFYTSPSSFTARFKKAVKMPVGIDTNFFKPDPTVQRLPNSVLFLGRIAPVKRVLEFVEWFNTQDPKFTATVAGAALPRDQHYEKAVREKVRELGLSDRVKFVGPVTQEGALKLFQSHELYVNKTPVGSFDKTIFEALASGMRLMVDNPDAKDLRIDQHSLKRLARRLEEEIK